MMQILFTDDDLARVRLSPTLDPFEELRTSAHNPVRRKDPALGGWVSETAARLGPAAVAIINDLRSPLVQFTGLGIKPDGTVHFEHQLERALAQPTSQWRAHTAEVHWYGFPIDTDLSDGKPAAIDALGDALSAYYDASLAPYWPALADASSAAVSTWSRIMSRFGVEGLFQRLHANAHWVPPVLRFERPGTPCPPGCGHALVEAVADRTSGRSFRVSERGLTIVPSVFLTMCVAWVVMDPVRGPAAEVLTVPIPASSELFADRQRDPRSDPLAQLLGPTRSWVLRVCCDDEVTTSGLGRVIGISASSASEHASALRAAGLITSRRQSNRVLHASTPMGLALVRGSDRPMPQTASVGQRRLV